jgi:hypothetical protein
MEKDRSLNEWVEFGVSLPDIPKTKEKPWTPGPWKACDLGEDNGGEPWYKWSVIHNGPLCYGGENTNGLENSKANAVVISAAPEMAEALETALDHIRQYSRYSEEMRKIGRGLSISSPTQPESMETWLVSILHRIGYPGF